MNLSNKGTRSLIVFIIVCLILSISLLNVINLGLTSTIPSKEGSSFSWSNKRFIERTSVFPIKKNFFKHPYWNKTLPENVSIDSKQAKAIVESIIPTLKVGTIVSFKENWIVSIEDEKGIIAFIRVSKINIHTTEQAKSIVEESLKMGWKVGEPKLVRAIYRIPLLDSNNVPITYVRVNGKTGEIIRVPAIAPAITKEQAKSIVNNAIKEFKIGEIKEKNNSWIVSIEYNKTVIMVIPIGKLNVLSSKDAFEIVQESLKNGWSAGEPIKLKLVYDVPIIDAYNNTIGSVKVDCRTGKIIPVVFHIRLNNLSMFK